MKKSVSFVLLAIILLQNCAVYNKRPVPISEAYDKGKVKVINISGESFKYNLISMEDDIYFGVKGKNLTQLDTVEIMSIHLKNINNSNSRTENIMAGVVIAGIIGGVIFLVWGIITIINGLDSL